jgi:hypothetical protein
VYFLLLRKESTPWKQLGLYVWIHPAPTDDGTAWSGYSRINGLAYRHVVSNPTVTSTYPTEGTRRWEDNIKTDTKELECIDGRWIDRPRTVFNGISWAESWSSAAGEI